MMEKLAAPMAIPVSTPRLKMASNGVSIRASRYMPMA
jgi:hypothetical protein